MLFDSPGILEILRRHDMPVSPSVAALLHTVAGGDLDTVLELAGRLSTDQRRGARPLPDPLPLVSSIVELYGDAAPAPWERRALLVAAVCRDDRIEVLIGAAGRCIDEIVDGNLGCWLTFVAGRFEFSDERTRIWAHEGASIAERTEAHRALAELYAERGEDDRSLWHRALSSLDGDPGLVMPLLRVAGDALESGDAGWAHAVAREAAGHADARRRSVARAAAGRAALLAGWPVEALEWLEPLMRESYDVGDTVAAYTLAKTLHTGAVPLAELEAARRRAATPSDHVRYARASAVAAALSAERGESIDVARLLSPIPDADALIGGAAAQPGPLRAWAELLSDGGCQDGLLDRGPISTLCRALRAGLTDAPQAGLRVIAEWDHQASGGDGLCAGIGRTPLMRAYFTVVETLLHTWAGDLAAASDVLAAGASALPVALPFNAMAPALARRLELSTHGRTGSLSAALAEAVPVAARHDRLVDRAIASYLSGRVDDAVAHLRLWAERRTPQPWLSLPGLDEVGPPQAGTGVIESADARRARAARQRIRMAAENTWAREYETACTESRQIRSPFERGRVEALIGVCCLTRDECAAGRRHLAAARSLFLEAGADAWGAAVDARLERVVDPFAGCRAAWEPLVTGRELEVAMLVADGRTNREIAARLVMSVRTVEVHVARLFTKLDVHSRGEMTALAHRTNQHV